MSTWLWHCWCRGADGLAVCREVRAKGKDQAARRCAAEWHQEPYRVVSAGYSAGEPEPRKLSRGNAAKLRGRAARALLVYRDVREDWLLPGVLSETLVTQATWRAFVADVGTALARLSRTQERDVHRWLAGHPGVQLPARLFQALSHLDEILDGEDASSLYSTLAWALIEIEHGLTPAEAMAAADRGRRVTVPG